MKSCVWPRNETYQFHCFWNTEQPYLTSLSIAFNLDLVVTVCHPQLEILTALRLWSNVAIWWPCRKTLEQFVESLKETWVLDELQLPLLEIAKFMALSILRMWWRIKVKIAWCLSHLYIIAKNAHYRENSGHFMNWSGYGCGLYKPK